MPQERVYIRKGEDYKWWIEHPGERATLVREAIAQKRAEAEQAKAHDQEVERLRQEDIKNSPTHMDPDQLL